MTRLLLRLLGIKDFEVCKSCETLKEQLLFEREEKQRLTDTLINIVSPKVVEASAPLEIKPIINSAGLFSRRRAALEEKDRQEAKILKESKNIGRPDVLIKNEENKKIEELESELGIEQEKEA